MASAGYEEDQLSAQEASGRSDYQRNLEYEPRQHSSKNFHNESESITSSGSNHAQLAIKIPSFHQGAQMAMSALQNLPVPILILSSLKTCVFVNKAMVRLCSSNPSDVDDAQVENQQDSFIGQTLSQIGIDMVHDGMPVFVVWEDFFDSIGHSSDTSASSHSSEDPFTPGSITPSGTTADPSHSQHGFAQIKNRRSTREATVDVVVSPNQRSYSPTQTTSHRRSRSSYTQIQASMITSVWWLESEKYYSLTFTSVAAPHSERYGSIIAKTSTFKSHQSTASSPGTGPLNASITTNSSMRSMNSAFSSPPNTPFLPLGPPIRTRLSSAPTLLQKVTKLKDAILNALHLPCYAIWRDESVGIPNEALMRMLPAQNKDEEGSQMAFISQFKAWTEDFSQPLSIDEYPIVRMLRTRQRVSGIKFGLIHPKTGHRHIYDANAEVIADEETGEFLGGVIVMKDVSAYIGEIEEQKQMNATQLNSITDCIPQLVWMNGPDGLPYWFSQKWYDYTGLTAEQSYGSNWITPLHPDDISHSAKAWNNALETGKEYVTEYRFRRWDGEYRWFLGRALPVRDEKGEIVRWFGTCTDIDESVQAREAARRTREQLLRVLETAQVSLWTVDTNGKITMVEGVSIWKSGIPSNEHAIGMKFEDALRAVGEGDKDIQRWKKPIDKILGGSTVDETIEAQISSNGRWWRTRLVPLVKNYYFAGGAREERFVDGVVGVSTDVTELKDKAQDLEDQEEENEKLYANALAAKEASRMKSQFLAPTHENREEYFGQIVSMKTQHPKNMSHEIRTPIAGVIGMAELLLDTTLDAEQCEFAENIQRSANGLLTVINDILDLSKVESGRLDVEEVQFSVSVVIRDAIKMLSFATDKKHLTCETNVEPSIGDDLRVIGDPGRVRQILTNLLTNSVKFTSEGTVTLRARIKKNTTDQLVIVFEVQDTGIGIEEEVQKKLFSPFSQADSSTARRYGGTGLGLTICKNLVELMNGDITLQSNLGFGTTVTFSIPFKKIPQSLSHPSLVDVGPIPERLQSDMSISCDSSDVSPVAITRLKASRDDQAPTVPPLPDAGIAYRWSQKTDPKTLPSSDRSNIHVLVVEDNHINQQIAIRFIKKLGFSVSAVWNGKEALDYLLEPPSGDHQMPDIVLMDVQMAIMDGYRATETIRHEEPFSSMPELQNLPIIAMTASAIQGDRDKCERAGMDDYLAKPVRVQTLEKMLVKWGLKLQSRRSSNMISGIPQETGTRSVANEGRSSYDEIMPGRRTATSRPASPNNNADPEIQSLSKQIIASTETEGDRSLRRAAAEEKAMALRDEKLLNVASRSENLMHGDLGQESHVAPIHATHTLTSENIEKLEEEQRARRSSNAQ